VGQTLAYIYNFQHDPDVQQEFLLEYNSVIQIKTLDCFVLKKNMLLSSIIT